MFIYYCSPNILDCTVRNNHANCMGGGIFCFFESAPMFRGNTIVTNTAEYGGGVNVHFSSSPTLQDNIIKNNTADHGGGLCCDYFSSPTIQGNSITGKSASSASGFGGGFSVITVARRRSSITRLPTILRRTPATA
ncbi:right-handed parallel beta-helix repeat-containing protein [bacterium]|nr:right-handed parallel beta-helix repeat-containing protein [bacterium]